MGDATTGGKRFRCRIGLHKWVLKVSDGERYHACKYCDKYNDKITANSNSPGGLGAGF